MTVYRNCRTLVATALTAGALALGTTAVNAQNYGSGQGGNPQGNPQGSSAYPSPQGAPAMDERNVKQFSKAYSEVQGIRDDLSKNLQDTDDRREANAMQQEAQREMLDAVKDQGLSVEGYNAMVSRMHSDPALREKVNEYARND